MPRVIITLIAEVIIFLAHLFLVKEKRRFFINIEKVYRLPKHSVFAKSFLRDHLRHQVYCQLETVVGIYNPKRVKIEGQDLLDSVIGNAQSKQSGLIVAAAHLGSWEFVAKYVSIANGQKFNALAKPSKYDWVTRFLESMRQRMHTNVLWTGKPSLLKGMIKVLKGGEVLGFVMDQKPENRKGPVVEFLGQPTAFVSGPASIALKCGTAIVGIYCVRIESFRFQLIAEEIYRPADEKVELDELTQMLASRLSYWIKLYPEQWTWSYKRWRD
ncbi:lysophospholipid acyltransferase family protein [Oligoflexaceae bacterium]|nr:lysophospholipid acyltransferase family protein [Oligoflexaceae bacterium]